MSKEIGVHNLKDISRLKKNVNLSKSYLFFDGKCPYSDTLISEENLQVDYVIPVAMGGTRDIYNVIPVCKTCNLNKGSKHLLDWWNNTHSVEEEYKLEKIYKYMVNKLMEYNDSLVNLQSEKNLNININDVDINTEKLDVFTFLYQLLNHLIYNSQYIYGDIDEYINFFNKLCNDNFTLSDKSFQLQNKLMLYLKSIGITNHYRVAFSKKNINLEEIINNVDNLKKYVKDNSISNIINQDPNIIFIDKEQFNNRVEYIVNDLKIPLEILLKKITIISDFESLKDLSNYCKEEKIDFNDIPNFVFLSRKIKDIKEVLITCKNNGLIAKDVIFKKNKEEIEKIIEICKKNGIRPEGTVFRRNSEEIKKIIEICKENDLKSEGNIFRRNPYEVEEIILFCRKNGIKVTSTMFEHSVIEIEKIVKVCRNNGIKPEGTIFLSTADEIEKIVDICKKNKINPVGTVFIKNAKEIEKIIEICKKNSIRVENTMFTKSSQQVEKIIEICNKYNIVISGSMFVKTADEIEKIIEICRINDIKLGAISTIFRRTSSEVEEIIKLCKKNEIKPEGTIFIRSADEVEKIIKVCRNNGIKPIGTVFTKSAKEVEEIIKLCSENNIEITNSIFCKNSKYLNESIEYLKNNYGDDYLKPLIVMISVDKLRLLFPYLNSLRVLPIVVNSASILTLSLDEIQERKNVLDEIGESMVIGNRFNSIFGLSKKNYAKKLESLNLINNGRRL